MDPQALDLATQSLAAAIDSLMATGSPFTPIVFVEKGGVRERRPVTVERGADPAAAAKQLAAGAVDADASAFAVSGAIVFGGARHDAIIVEAWNFRAARGARIGLRYELKGVMRKRPSLLGSPLHLGRNGWYDPEEGEPAVRPAEPPTFPEVVRVAPASVSPAPVAPGPIAPAPGPAPQAPAPDPGFGPPPAPETLAPAEVAPPPPDSAAPPALPRAFSAPQGSPRVGAPPVPADAQPSTAEELPAEELPAEPPAPVVASFAPPVLAPPAAPAAPAAPGRAEAGFPPPAEPQGPPGPATGHPAADSGPPDVQSAPAPAAHPVDAQAPAYVAVPLQRNETPLGNRAMFAGIMELATKGRSFPAFAIVQKDGAWEQVTMTDSSLEDAAASVRAYARTRTDADFIAFAIDGSVPVDGVPVEAVIVEVWEYATRVSFSVAQRYIPTGSPPSPRLSGRPLMRTAEGWVDVPSSMVLGGQVQFGYRDPDSA